jgi:hypothetical protein
MNRNCVLAFPNRIDDTTHNTTILSGGNWVAGLPLSNLKDPRLSKVARTASLAEEDTCFDVDMGRAFRIHVIALLRHNLSLAGRFRARAYSDEEHTSLVYDSGVMRAWPVVYPPELLDWEDNNFWDGTWAAEIAENYPIFSLLVLDPKVVARYWHIDLIDTANPKGFIDIGRLIMATGWQPTFNMDWGYSLKWETQANIDRTLGGPEIIEDIASGRVARVTLSNLTDHEAMAMILDMQIQLGRSGQVFFVADPSDTLHMLRRSFLATISRPDDIVHRFYNVQANTLELKEVL